MLAGNISGSYTQLGRVVVQNSQPHLIDYEIFDNSDFSDFHSVLGLYLRKKRINATFACIGVAGPVLNNSAKATNLNWRIDGMDLCETYNFEKVRIINDLEATAYGLDSLREDKILSINTGKKVETGNSAIIAPGSGLGQCLIYYDGDKHVPLASEGGHASFSPDSQIEVELWEYLYSSMGKVEAEDVISKGGLVKIFEFMNYTNKKDLPGWFLDAEDRSGIMIEKALSGEDEQAVKALDLFIDCFASEASNLALKGMTLGGIYLTGSLITQVMTAIDKQRFMDRFVHRGKLSKILAHIPVDLIIDNKCAIKGASGLVVGLSK